LASPLTVAPENALAGLNENGRRKLDVCARRRMMAPRFIIVELRSWSLATTVRSRVRTVNEICKKLLSGTRYTPTMKKVLYLVRHGESIANIATDEMVESNPGKCHINLC